MNENEFKNLLLFGKDIWGMNYEEAAWFLISGS